MPEALFMSVDCNKNVVVLVEQIKGEPIYDIWPQLTSFLEGLKSEIRQWPKVEFVRCEVANGVGVLRVKLRDTYHFLGPVDVGPICDIEISDAELHQWRADLQTFGQIQLAFIQARLGIED